MQKGLLGKLDGTLVFHYEQGLNFDDKGLKFAAHSKCGITCPNCMEHESCDELNLSSKLAPMGVSLFAVVERITTGRSATISNWASTMSLLPISFDWTDFNYFNHPFFDLTPILENFISRLNVRPVVDVIDNLVREGANWAYENQVRYRIIQVGLISGLHCANCDSLTIMDPILYGYHVRRSPIMRAGKDMRAVVSKDQLYLFNKSSIFRNCLISETKEFLNNYQDRELLFCEANGECMELKGIRIEGDGDDQRIIGVLDEFDEDGSKGMTNTATTSSQLVELGNFDVIGDIYELNHVIPIGNSDHMMKSSELFNLIKALGVPLAEENYGIGVIER